MKPIEKMSRYASAWRCGIVALLSAWTLAGCVTQPLPVYQVSLQNQVALAKLAPGARYRTSSVNAPLEASASVRAYSAMPPQGGWSAFLEEGLRKELTSAQHYDKDAQKHIEVTVIKLNFRDGVAELASRFVVRQAGVVVYDKVLSVQSNWSSPFLGVLAVSDAIIQYGAAFQQLQRKLFDDVDFIRLT
ncbi:hypothetical protein [Herbaspirillum sp. NPDC087042]|uniref:hypothetical protein n=1 Tax=Herbaspirillum sp. NPDC087042 TaxID=3364004 RepID=UPI0038250436